MTEISDGDTAGEDTPSEWYISGPHARRALGYLGATLAELGHLNADFEQPVLLDVWGEALEATMEVDDDPPSPVGARSREGDPE